MKHTTNALKVRKRRPHKHNYKKLNKFSKSRDSILDLETEHKEQITLIPFCKTVRL